MTSPSSDTSLVAALLTRSFGEARARWLKAFPGAIPDESLRTALGSLIQALAHELELPPGRLDTTSEQDLPLTHRPELHGIRSTLLDYIRQHFLAACGRPVGLERVDADPESDTDAGPDGLSPADVVRVLAALERISAQLKPDWEHELQAGLMGPGAEDLLAEIGHDLRSPLTSVLFLSEALRNGQSGPINKVQSRQLALIYSAGFTMMTVVNNFVELSRTGADAGPPALATMSVNEVMESLRESLQPMAEDRGIHLEMDFLEGGDRVEGHPVFLYRILLNLASNGIRYSDEGDTVRVSAAHVSTSELSFAVTDTGPGIAPEKQAHIFRAFEPSADRRGVRFSGTGLGLTIVRKLLRELRGSELRCESEPGEGTRFQFELPFRATSDRAPSELG